MGRTVGQLFRHVSVDKSDASPEDVRIGETPFCWKESREAGQLCGGSFFLFWGGCTAVSPTGSSAAVAGKDGQRRKELVREEGYETAGDRSADKSAEIIIRTRFSTGVYSGDLLVTDEGGKAAAIDVTNELNPSAEIFSTKSRGCSPVPPGRRT